MPIQSECLRCGYLGDDFYHHTPHRCRPCVREVNAEWRAKNPTYMAAHARERRKKTPKRFEHLMNRYGITYETYLSMLEEQGGVCAVCSAPPGRRVLCVDHNHETGRVRGLLCSNCNAGIGMLGDDPDRLESAITYLKDAA